MTPLAISIAVCIWMSYKQLSDLVLVGTLESACLDNPGTGVGNIHLEVVRSCLGAAVRYSVAALEATPS